VLNQRGRLVMRASVDVVWRREQVAHEPLPSHDGRPEPVLL
jgi:hypothetical protein